MFRDTYSAHAYRGIDPAAIDSSARWRCQPTTTARSRRRSVCGFGVINAPFFQLTDLSDELTDEHEDVEHVEYSGEKSGHPESAAAFAVSGLFFQDWLVLFRVGSLQLARPFCGTLTQEATWVSTSGSGAEGWVLVTGQDRCDEMLQGFSLS